MDAYLAGVKAAAHLGLQRVVFETDAMLLKDAPEGDEYRLSAMVGILLGLKLRCRSL